MLGLMRWFTDWVYSWSPAWWNSTYLAQVQSAFSVIGVVVGAGLAYLALRIARSQEKMQKQEHEHFLQQLADRPDVHLWVSGQVGTTAGFTMLSLTARNGGRAVADGFSWEILLPPQVHGFVMFFSDDGTPAQPTMMWDVSTQRMRYYFLKHVHEGKLFVSDLVNVCGILVNSNDFEPFQIQWRVYGQFKTEPESGYHTIRVAPRQPGLLDVQPVLALP